MVCPWRAWTKCFRAGTPRESGSSSARNCRKRHTGNDGHPRRRQVHRRIEHAAVGVNPKISGLHNNLANVLAQKKAAAVAALARVIEFDSQFRDMAKHDSDYDAIRDDRAFRKLTCDEYPTPVPGTPATAQEALRPFKHGWPKK